MKLVMGLIVATAVAAGGGFFWFKGRPSPANDPSTTLATVIRGGITQSVTSTGLVASNVDIPIKCRASGQVVQLGPKDRTKDFDKGDTVNAGDLLLQLDTSDEERPLEQANVLLAQSQAKLEQAKLNLLVAQQQLVTGREKADADLASAEAQKKDADAKATRRKELLDQSLGSQEDYDTAVDTAAQMAANVANARIAIEQLLAQEAGLHVLEQAVKVAQSDVATNQISVDIARQNLAYTTIAAPLSGVVTDLTIQKGATVTSATSGASAGTQVMVLSDFSKIFILANIDESDMDKVRAGQDVRITADARPGQQFTGKVIRYDPFGVNVSNVVTFEVKIEVTSANKSQLWPQMTTNIEIVEAQRDNTLIVPKMAVVQKGGVSTVAVRKADGKTEDRQVATGIADISNIEILSGVSEGEQVVVHKNAADSHWTNKPVADGRHS